ncbi:ABC transporter permease [Vibrio cincinnatiensis]|uniref:ABC-2 type transport system permease protein n=1 Tax=Vibrio cincinnatiensis DSM 19608 TaxID=1123491 RepID=A0A1T4KVF6_VIBCI|nr:ABC transporter permease [Vibrio cincinnatiensis]MCG3760626.1 ABC transporter permease [Vibrio cincinnatiensis]MCG3763930.1 ABC transporter permease [Vibrio cincinnatiensis]SJZ46360.1 ABC-2 type transport system permease protein [Vibrio cincinnatiensis DSM 19608]SUP48369.1 export ABC transporter permease [Vibrio cincinnatiensis]
MRNSLPSQWQLLRHDHWLLSCLTWVPILLGALLWWIFSQGVLQNLPIGVVDLSHSQLSRQLTRDLEATSTLSVTRQYQSIEEAKKDLVTSQIYAYVIIPSQFDKEIYRGEKPKVTTFYNSQYILVGRLINSAILQAQGTLNAQLEGIKTLAHGNQTSLSAMGQAVPVRTQMTPLFNKNNHYTQFLVSAAVPAVWQILIVVTTIMILSANYREYGLTHWLGERPLRHLASTLTPYSVIFLLQGVIFLVCFYRLMQWPMHGSLFVIIFAQIITVVACIIMGALFYFLTLDPARAMSFAGAFTAPSFAFMGVTFPASDMNNLALIWRSLLPISHYIEVQLTQVNYGLYASESLQHLIPMMGYSIPLLLTLALIRKHQTKEVQSRGNHDLV